MSSPARFTVTGASTGALFGASLRAGDAVPRLRGYGVHPAILRDELERLEEGQAFNVGETYGEVTRRAGSVGVNVHRARIA